MFAFALARAIDERRNDLKIRKSNANIISIEDKQLGLLRNLRFKYFLMSVIGRCLPVIIGKNIDIAAVGLAPNYSRAASKSINDIIAELIPLVNLVLTYTSSLITNDFSDFIRGDNVLDRISTQVQSMIYASNNPTIPNPLLERISDMLSE